MMGVPFRHLLSMPPGRLPVAVILTNWEKTKAGNIKNMLEGLNIPSGLGTLPDAPENSQSSTGEKDFSAPQRQSSL